MNANVFIASSFDGRAGLGMTRAAGSSAGEWQTRVVAKAYDVRCLARHPSDGRIAYAGTQGSGVLISRDAGATWQRLGLAGQTVKSLAVNLRQPETLMPASDPRAPGHLYAGLSNGEVWFSASRGDEWQNLPFNLRGIWHQLVML